VDGTAILKVQVSLSKCLTTLSVVQKGSDDDRYDFTVPSRVWGDAMYRIVDGEQWEKCVLHLNPGRAGTSAESIDEDLQYLHAQSGRVVVVAQRIMTASIGSEAVQGAALQ
jgi:hypothetical protein